MDVDFRGESWNQCPMVTKGWLEVQAPYPSLSGPHVVWNLPVPHFPCHSPPALADCPLIFEQATLTVLHIWPLEIPVTFWAWLCFHKKGCIVTREDTVEFPLKTENRLNSWSSLPTPGHMSEENSNSKSHMHLNAHSSTIYNSQDMAKTQMSVDSWLDKDVVVYLYKGILLNH